MTLAQAQQEYQVLLEHHRRRPEDEETWQLLVHAREQRDRLWLEHLMTFSRTA